MAVPSRIVNASSLPTRSSRAPLGGGTLWISGGRSAGCRTVGASIGLVTRVAAPPCSTTPAVRDRPPLVAPSELLGAEAPSPADCGDVSGGGSPARCPPPQRRSGVSDVGSTKHSRPLMIHDMVGKHAGPTGELTVTVVTDV